MGIPGRRAFPVEARTERSETNSHTHTHILQKHIGLERHGGYDAKTIWKHSSALYSVDFISEEWKRQTRASVIPGIVGTGRRRELQIPEGIAGPTPRTLRTPRQMPSLPTSYCSPLLTPFLYPLHLQINKLSLTCFFLSSFLQSLLFLISVYSLNI